MVCGQCGNTNPGEAAHCTSCGSRLFAEPIRYDDQAATVVDYSLAPTSIDAVSSIATEEILESEPRPNTALLDTAVQTHTTGNGSNGSKARLAPVASTDTDPQSQAMAEDLLATREDSRPRPHHAPEQTDWPLTDTMPHHLIQTARATPEQLAEMAALSKTPDQPEIERRKAAKTDPVAKPTPRAQPSSPTPPTQPASRLIRVLMALFGLGLLGIFAAGLLVGGMPTDIVATVRALPFRQLYIVLAGVVLLLAAVVPLPYTVRGALAACLGIAPLVLMLIDWQLDWRRSVTLVAMVLVPAALLHRARHHKTVFARVIIAIGILALLAPLLVPAGGVIPVKQLLTGLQLGPFYQLAPRLYPLVVALLCLLCLLPLLLPRRSGLARLWALALLVYLPVQMWLEVAVSVSSVGEAISSRLAMLTHGLAVFAFLTIAAMGLAHVIWSLSGTAKQAEVVPPT